MNLDSLVLALPSLSPSDVHQWWAEFHQENPMGARDDFFNWLFEHDRLSEIELWDALNGSDLSLVEDDDADAYLSDTGTASKKSYQFIQELGVGAMGEVHIVRENFLRRKVALKFIRTDRANDRSQARFVREALITAQLDHPNIVPIYNYEMALDGNPAYTMKWIKGRTLEEIIDECKQEVDLGRPTGAPDLFERLDLFLKLCEAMYYSHSRKVIHRDLKPANVMVGPFGELYVMDWGIARVVGQTDSLESNTEVNAFAEDLDLEGDAFDTQDGSIVGTVAYLSPEQARGEILDLSVSSDQYALGLILFELVYLAKGLQRGQMRDMLRRAQRGQMAPYVHYNPNETVPPELEAIIRQACAFLPERRYDSVDELAEDIRRYMRDESITVYKDPPLTVIMRWVSKHRLQAFALVVLVVVAGLGTALYSLTREQQLREQNLLREAEIQETLQVRNRQVGQLVADSAKQANQIAQEMLHYQGLLRELVASAQSRLLFANALPVQRVFQHTDYMGSNPPSDLALSERYQLNISTKYPVVKRAPGIVGTRLVTLRESQLVSLAPIFQNIFAQSMAEPMTQFADLDQAIRTTGTPLVWSYVALEDGIHVAYPGKGTYSDTYDPRQRPWYQDSVDHVTPTCLPPYTDSMGQGLLLPCTLSVRTESGTLMGVAGIELSLGHFSEQSLAFQSAAVSAEVVHSLLLNASGEILATHNSEQAVGDVFKQRQILKEIQAGRAGYSLIHPTQGIVRTEQDPLQVPNGDFYFYQPVGDAGWTYVVYGSAVDILSQ